MGFEPNPRNRPLHRSHLNQTGPPITTCPAREYGRHVSPGHYIVTQTPRHHRRRRNNHKFRRNKPESETSSPIFPPGLFPMESVIETIPRSHLEPPANTTRSTKSPQIKRLQSVLHRRHTNMRHKFQIERPSSD